MYRKESDDPRHDLVGEGERLSWLRRHGVPAAEVLECRPGLLVTAEVPGGSAAGAWPADCVPDLDEPRRGWTRAELIAELLATRPGDEDTVVCHGDLSLSNVLLDPATCRVSGLIDAGRVGVADRWVDLAIVTRSLAGHPDPHVGSMVDRCLDRYGVAQDPVKDGFYRLLDEFA